MLTLLLHMHQPDYRDPRTGEPRMPWVRLHATRGYRDVPWVVRATGARVTVNLVPSLIDQWEHYARGGTDLWLRLARRPSESLEPAEADWILRNFFAGNPGAFRWFPAWGALRGRASGRATPAFLRDVTVWSQLAWFGFSALRDYPELRELREKGQGYSEAEKERVLDLQIVILRELHALYRELPDVSCSPYYHPILPLLVDTAHAARCLPGVPDPGFRHPEDAHEQLVTARERVGAWLGRPVTGLWPSEGSVSPEVVEMAADAGFRWFATDQGVLERSARSEGTHRGSWQVGRMRGLFRDRELSDRIGFTYAHWPGARAAQDLRGRVGGAPVLAALDGENPWEAYPDAGDAFLHALLGSVATRTCAEMAEAEPVGSVERIHTGSWIDANFKIWIGHAEDRRAWRLLAAARERWDELGRPEAARRHLLAAEGSDWFWWYGDEFSTPFEGEFDRLFRAHLAAAWSAMGEPIPPELGVPMKRRPGLDVTPPRAALTVPDGDDWFAWAGAGRVDLRAGAMAPMRGAPSALLFGDRGGRLHLRLLPGGEGWTVVTEAGRVLFERDRALLDGDAVVLEGPDGERIPAEGNLRLPWRGRAQRLV